MGFREFLELTVVENIEAIEGTYYVPWKYTDFRIARFFENVLELQVW